MPTTSPGSPSLLLSLRNIYETFAISFPTVVDAARHRVRKEVCDDRLGSWAARVVANSQIDLHVTGREHLEPGVSYVVMSNHQSLYDIPVLFCAIGSNLRMVAKRELFRVPIFGGAMREAGFISIDRGNRNSAVESLRIARQMVTNGVHVWIAPEGTRSKDGELLPFKKGGFALAMEADLPILPVSVTGTKEALPAKALRSRTGAHVRVTLHPPIKPSAYSNSDRQKKDGAVRATVAENRRVRDLLMSDVRKSIERDVTSA